MSRLGFINPGDFGFVVPDGVEFVTIAAQAPRRLSVAARLIPVSPGDIIEGTIAGEVDQSSGAGGSNGGGTGHVAPAGAVKASSWFDPGGPTIYGELSTAGTGRTEVTLEGTLILVAPGLVGPALVFDRYSGPYYGGSGIPFAYWGYLIRRDADFGDGLTGDGDPTVDSVSSLPSASDPNRAPSTTPGDDLPAYTLHELGNPGGTKNGGSANGPYTYTVEEYSADGGVTLSGAIRERIIYPGAGSAGYGGGASGSTFENLAPGVPNFRPQGGRSGTYYSLYTPSEDTIPNFGDPGIQAAVAISWADTPVAVLNGPDTWDGQLHDGEVPGWITFTIFGSTIDIQDDFADEEEIWWTGTIVVSPTDPEYLAWQAAGSPIPSAQYGTRRPLRADLLDLGGGVFTQVQWQVVDLANDELVFEDTESANATNGVIRWLTAAGPLGYVDIHGEAPPSGRYKIRMRLRGRGLPGATATGPWSDWAERIFTIGGGFWAVGRARRR